MTNTPTLQSILLISNPKSRQGERGLSDFIAALEAAGVQVTQRELSPESQIPELLQDAAQFGAVVAAGGDGTVSSAAYALRGQDVPLMAYPAGTANLIAQNLDLPKDPAELAQVLLHGRSVALDLGEIEVAGQKNGFCMLAGAGVDANMIKDSEEYKDKFGVLAYVMSAVKQINPQKTTFKLVIDGQPREFEGMGVMIANLGMANYRLPITTDISPNDGRFTVILLRADSVFRLLPNLIDSVRARLNLGDPMFDSNLETIEAREITIDAVDPFPLQYDGEAHSETTPFTARILPRAVRFFTLASQEDLQT